MGFLAALGSTRRGGAAGYTWTRPAPRGQLVVPCQQMLTPVRAFQQKGLLDDYSYMGEAMLGELDTLQQQIMIEKAVAAAVSQAVQQIVGKVCGG